MTYIQLKRAMAQIELAAEQQEASATPYGAAGHSLDFALNYLSRTLGNIDRLKHARALLVPQPGQTVEVKLRAHVEEVLLDEDTLGYVARVRVWGDGHWKGVLLDLPGDAVTNILP